MGIGNYVEGEQENDSSHWEQGRNESKISPLQWECSIYTASETSLSKYTTQDWAGVNPGVHEIVSVNDKFDGFTLFTAGGKLISAVGEQRVQEPRHTSALGWD